MATKKKLLQAAAGTASAAGGAALSVENVFSTYLYEGNTNGQAIENGINLGQSYGSGSMSMNLKRLDLGTLIALSQDFTIEAWIFIQDDPESYLNILGSSSASGYNFQFGKDPNNRLTLYNNSTFLLGSSTNNQIPLGEWVHVAVSRSGTLIRFFVNGTQLGSTTDSTTYRWNQVGNVLDTYYEWDGYMSGLRILDGTALYTSSFTPPTSNLTAITNTVLLLGQGDTPLVDESTNSVSITNTGVTASTFGPFDAAEAGEGGLVWCKSRTAPSSGGAHFLYSPDHGIESNGYYNSLSTPYSEGFNFNDVYLPSVYGGINGFTSTGFTIGAGSNTSNFWPNESGHDYVSWTWRKAPRFFDCVTYTGDGTSPRSISHNLDSPVGCIIVKRTDATGNWPVWHRSTGDDYRAGYLNLTNAGGASSTMIRSASSSAFTLGDNTAVNASGGTYVAYLFAHNDGDGEFGPDGDADIIKCGSYTGTGSSGLDVDLGFEPQWLLIKNTDAASTWYILDNMRGIVTGVGDSYLRANFNNENTVASNDLIDLTPTGFKVINTGSGWNSISNDYIYIAIRRGPMAVPEDADDVFFIDTFGSTGDGKEPAFRSTFPVDMQIYQSTTGTSPVNTARLTQGKFFSINTNDAENTGSWAQFDYQNGFYGDDTTTISHYYSWMWRRAPNYFDAVAYTGNGTAGHTISHNLGVVPEMMWVKRRDGTGDWIVYHKGVANDPETDYLVLNSSAAATDSRFFWDDTAPTDSVFSVGTNNQINRNTSTYIAYLFASLDGVSKVGSFSHTNGGGDTNVDCGFSSGARFVILKRYSDTGGWLVLDAERGIVSGNDPWLAWNSSSAQFTTDDVIDPLSSGFTVVSSFLATGNYIFYAIA